jgi:outer membrane scaffolding protein for murein synthesis (MipA/OmpV family)
MVRFELPFAWLLRIIALCLLAPAVAPAQTPAPFGEWQYSAGVVLRPRFEDPLPDWDASVGVAEALLPRYPGSGQLHGQLSPTVDIYYKDLAFLSMGEGLGINLLRGASYRAGVSVGYDLGRDQHNARALQGMGDIGAAAEPKLFGEVVLFPVVLRAALRRGVGGNDGWVGDLSAYSVIAGSSHYALFAGLTASAADQSFQRRFFGVTPLQAQRSFYPVFNAGGGLESAGVGTNLLWFCSEHWLVTSEAAAQRLLGDAGRSPLSNDATQLLWRVSIAYQF